MVFTSSRSEGGASTPNFDGWVVHYSAVHRVKIVVAAMEGGLKSEAQH